MRHLILSLTLVSIIFVSGCIGNPAADPAVTQPATQPVKDATTIEKVVRVVETVGLPVAEALTIAGVPFAGLVVMLWRNSRQKRLTANLVRSVQAGRDALLMSKGDEKNHIKCFDKAVGRVQSDAVVSLVKKIKKAC